MFDTVLYCKSRHAWSSDMFVFTLQEIIGGRAHSLWAACLNSFADSSHLVGVKCFRPFLTMTENCFV